MKLFNKIALLSVFTMLVMGCQEPYMPVDTIPVMKTLPVDSRTATTAVLKGCIVKAALESESPSNTPDYYFLLSRNSNLDNPQSIAVKRSHNTAQYDSCHAYVSELLPATTYYYKLCVSNKYSLVEGETLSFSTEVNTITNVTTNPVTDCSETTAVLTGTFVAETDCWAFFEIADNPSFDTSRTLESVVVDDSCYTLVSGLNPGTTYYYKMSVHDHFSTAEGKVLSFKTKGTSHQYVDLGLSVNWSICNIGAVNPEEFGNYYAWGETTSKSSYSIDNYSFFADTTFVEIGTDISGTSYDAARTEWGDQWRLPTLNEAKELMEKCTWQWTKLNGVHGQMVTGPNGNHIFLPATGGINDSDVVDVGSFGRYWTGSILEYTDKACYLGFEEGFVGWNYNYRYLGRTIRPVIDR